MQICFDLHVLRDIFLVTISAAPKEHDFVAVDEWNKLH